MTTSYSYARDNLAELWDEAEDSREAVIVTRRGHEDMALLPAAELRSLREISHLLRSPANAERLLKALARSRAKGGKRFASIQDLAVSVGLSD